MFQGALLVVITIFGTNVVVSYKHGSITTDVANLGKVKGTLETTSIGVDFYSYMGIPFAEPPVNELRLEPPVVKKPWSGVWDATFERGCCYQMTNDRPEETEDCLYLNVYTPTKTFNESLPVMFYIYGGGFIEGYSERVNSGPEHLMEHGVILVTSNYRVGPFGFFSTGDTIIPGNLGLKDQLLALKWVNEHISSFGGDPNKITIIGQSAGGASVTYHLLSPQSKGLFQAAISESATALSPWAYQNDLPRVCHYLATLMNPEFKKKRPTSSQLLKFMKSVPAKVIDKASYYLDQEFDLSAGYIQIEQGFFFSPTIEPEHEGAFLTSSMYDLLKSGTFNQVPTLIGVNTEECLFYARNRTQISAYVKGFDQNSKFLVPQGLNITEGEKLDEVSKQIKNFYLKEGTFTAHNRSLIKYLSDQGFARSIVKHAQLQSKYSPVYFYQFAFHGVLGGQTSTTVSGFSEDVVHGEELDFILTRSYGGLNTTDLTKYPEVDQTVQKRMITSFTNFAKYLNPTPKTEELFQNLTWPTVKPDNFLYMDIGSDLEIRKDPKNEMFQFWEKIFDQYGKHLITY